MRPGRSAYRTALTLAAVLAIVGLVGTAVYAASTKATFTIGANPTSQTVQQGHSASYALTVSGSGGFIGSVSLSASVSPAGPTAGISPASVTISSGTSAASATLTAVAGTDTPPGTYTVTVTGTSGKTKASTSVTLTVSRSLSTAFTLAASPSSVSVPAGSTAVYALSITRTGGFTGAVALDTYGSKPPGSTATFSPNPATGTSATMQVTTDAASTAQGTYPIYVVGSATVNGSTQYQYAQTQLVVSAPTGSGLPFTISGNLAGDLAPGRAALPLNLSLTNPNKSSLSITNLTVTISRITQASSVPAQSTCGTVDYVLTQYAGAYPLALAGGKTATLTALGVPVSSLPRLGMIDRPVLQDGCKGATLALAYSGSAQGS